MGTRAVKAMNCDEGRDYTQQSDSANSFQWQMESPEMNLYQHMHQSGRFIIVDSIFLAMVLLMNFI